MVMEAFTSALRYTTLALTKTLHGRGLKILLKKN
jgi:hypothetical protein